MTVYQEAHQKIDQFPEETVYLFIQLMDRMASAKPARGKTSGKANKLSDATENMDEKTISQLKDTRESAAKALAGLWKTHGNEQTVEETVR